MIERSVKLTSVIRSITGIASRFNLAVLVTNHITSFTPDTPEAVLNATQIIQPLLGPVWWHAVTTQILLAIGMDGKRVLSIQKSSYLPPASVAFLSCVFVLFLSSSYQRWHRESMTCLLAKRLPRVLHMLSPLDPLVNGNDVLPQRVRLHVQLRHILQTLVYHKTVAIGHIYASRTHPTPTLYRHLPNRIHAVHHHQHSDLGTVRQHKLVHVHRARLALLHVLLVAIQRLLPDDEVPQHRQVYASLSPGSPTGNHALLHHRERLVANPNAAQRWHVCHSPRTTTLTIDT